MGKVELDEFAYVYWDGAQWRVDWEKFDANSKVISAQVSDCREREDVSDDNSTE